MLEKHFANGSSDRFAVDHLEVVEGDRSVAVGPIYMAMGSVMPTPALLIHVDPVLSPLKDTNHVASCSEYSVGIYSVCIKSWPSSRTRMRMPGSTSVVDPGSSTMQGPSILVPGLSE
jgi:hypothetical protein